MNFLLQLLISVVMMIASYLLAPKPKVPAKEIEQGEIPTASAGVPVPRLFGTMTIKNPNCLWYGDKYYIKSKVDA
jgi:hypothetical protein